MSADTSVSAAVLTACSCGIANLISVSAGLVDGSHAIERSVFQAIAVVTYILIRRTMR